MNVNFAYNVKFLLDFIAAKNILAAGHPALAGRTEPLARQ